MSNTLERRAKRGLTDAMLSGRRRNERAGVCASSSGPSWSGIASFLPEHGSVGRSLKPAERSFLG
jgi:hypothetical protein